MTNGACYSVVLAIKLLYYFSSRQIVDYMRVFGVPKLAWSEAAKVEGGVPWHAGVLKGAERFMTSWHKGEEEAGLKIV